jgi:hypothetical protein
MNLAALRVRVRTLLGEDIRVQTTFSDAWVDREINDAYVELCRVTGCLEGRTFIDADSTTGEYATPDEVGEILRVAYDNFALQPETSRRMDKLDQEWPTRTGQPERWLTDRTDHNALVIYPIPDATSTVVSFDQEAGAVVDIDDAAAEHTYVFDQEFGVVVSITDADADHHFEFDQEQGGAVFLDAPDEAFEIWHKRVPARMSGPQTPDVPETYQMGIVYAAASNLLRAISELRNEPLAELYKNLASDVALDLAAHISERNTANRTVRVAPRRTRKRNLIRDTSINATGRAGAGD